MQILAIGTAVKTLLSEAFWPLLGWAALLVAGGVVGFLTTHVLLNSDSDKREPWQ